MAIKTRTVLLSVVALAVAGGLGYFAFRPQPVAVDIVDAGRGEMMITIDADGETRIRDVYEVAAPVSGTAQRSPVAVGDTVSKDETVVAVVQPLEPGFLDARSRVQAEAAVREAEASVQVAESKVHQAEEELNYAESRYDRVQKLVERGVSSITQLEDASQQKTLRETALESAKLGKSAADSALARAKAALIEPGGDGSSAQSTCCVPITAPIDGVVLSIANVSERPVTAGAPLLSIGHPENLEIVADILSSDAVRIHKGDRALVERWGGDETLEATVREIDPSAHTKVSALGIEEQRVDVTLEFADGEAADKGLGDGYSVFVKVIVWEGKDVLQVPLSALFRDDGGWALFTVADGVARLAPVEVGRRSGLMAEVLSGIDAGTKVITHPSDQVADGVEVIDRKAL